MLFLDYYKPADPPMPDAQDLRRMALDAVRDGLPVSLVARLFDVPLEELERLIASREERRRQRAEAIMAGRREAARRRATDVELSDAIGEPEIQARCNDERSAAAHGAAPC